MGVLYSKRNGVWLMVSGGKKEPYNEALALVGIDKVDSLEAVLTNSDYCTALAGNADAYAIMKDNYSADMTTAVDSAWNEGLNTLNYKCGLKCWLFKAGNQCSGITGGWGRYNKGYVGTSDFGINSGSSSWSMVYTNNAINGSYSKLYFVISSISGEMKYGIANAKNSDSNWKEVGWNSSKTTLPVTFKEGGYPSIRIGDDASSRYVKVSNVYLIP